MDASRCVVRHPFRSYGGRMSMVGGFAVSSGPVRVPTTVRFGEWLAGPGGGMEFGREQVIAVGL